MTSGRSLLELADTSSLRRALLRRRRLITALLTTTAVVAAIGVLAPADPATTSVIVAAGDLDAGQVIGADDVRRVSITPEAAPERAFDEPAEVVGQQVAGPMRAGEPFTDRRLTSAGLLTGYADELVATPLRVAEPAVADLLDVGDHIDVYAAAGAAVGSARLVASDAAVLALPQGDERQGDGAVIVLALTPTETAQLAQASATTTLTVSVRR